MSHCREFRSGFNQIKNGSTYGIHQFIPRHLTCTIDTSINPHNANIIKLTYVILNLNHTDVSYPNQITQYEKMLMFSYLKISHT